ncbi:hypothetical protein [Saccharopolyspora taberi]|uniref:Uncharacterized protein n=1 Tax=Saccharopolyspora taberi TaxID=60895 RepID=A0ABN3VFB4_9PSEU
MSAEAWVKLLVDDEGLRWRTVSPQRRVLVVVHNVTAATRLLDILPLWSEDVRVQTVFTCIGSSAFTNGTDEFLAARGITPIPWDEAARRPFDLAVSASHGGPLHEVGAPLIIVPHGMGYNKFLETGNRKPETGNRKPETGNRKPETGNRKPETGNRKPVFGLSPDWLMHGGRLVPSVAVLSHVEQRERLRVSCPEAVDAVLVAGDPCLDRITASRPLRETYRHALGARPEHRVLVVSSTWGPASLFGRDASLVLRLAKELPIDEYRIVLALHPNVWDGHSPWQVRRWLAECTRAGVVVLPPEEGWRAALVAADLTVGDHGSVTFYSAANGTPVLLASWPENAVDPGSPIAQLLASAPRLRPGGLAGQVDEVIRDHHPDRYRTITDLATSEPGRAARLLRAEIYSRMDLPEPPEPAEPAAVPVPEVESASSPSQLVSVGFDGATAVVVRHPASALSDPALLPADSILVTSTATPHRRWLELAEIVIHDGVHDDPRHWADATLTELPGCLLAAVRSAGGWAVTGLGLPVVHFSGPEDLGPVYAATLHAWLRTGLPIEDIPDEVSLRLGRREVTARIAGASPASAPPAR